MRLVYQEWREQDKELYDILLWALDVVKICSVHDQRLCLYCPHCEKVLPYLSSQARPGYCVHCRSWLGLSLNETTKEREVSEILSREEVTWQNWVVDVMGELFASQPDVDMPLSKERMSDAISLCVDHLTGGNATAFVNELRESNIQLSKWSVWDWRKGKQLPQLETFLKICYYLGTTPLELFTKQYPNFGQSQVYLPEDSDSKTKTVKKSFNTEKLRRGLEKFVRSKEFPPLSMAEVSRRLNHDHSHLRKLFPELCISISKRYWTYQRTQKEARKQRVRQEVRQITMKVHASGKYPSLRQVRKHLSDPNLMRLPEAQETWRLILWELGYRLT